jgi:Fe2+ transport system protein FeoA
MKLGNLKTNDIAKIQIIEGGKEIKIKLMSLGLNIGTEVLMIKNDFKGPIIIAIDQNRIILGRELSNKIEILKI